MTPDNLRQKTQNYWLQTEGTDHSQAIRQYVHDLLPYELAYARERNASSSCEPPCDWLALLVGYSWEPLLQVAVCVYQPQNILLVLNEDYGGTAGPAWGRELAEIIGDLPSDLYPNVSKVQIHPDPLECAGERPARIFRFLRDWFVPRQREAARPRIVLDITGAKKSMVAGAYLFAAHANVDVSYVDFDDYDPKRSRPYGYSCRIGLLANPYEAFRLRDWQRVGQLYGQYSFRAARTLLSDIMVAAGQPLESGSDDALYIDGERQAIHHLGLALRAYECWDNGDLVGARNQCEDLQNQVKAFQPPTAVVELPGRDDKGEEQWPRADVQATALFEAFGRLELGSTKQDPSPNLLKSLYMQERPLLIYAHDELAKIDRLINYKEDYRSALIRAAGLHENLITARLLWLWMNDKLYYSREGGPFSLRNGISDAKQISKTDKAVAQVRVAAAIPGLQRSDQPSKPQQFPVYQAEPHPRLEKFWDGLSIDWQRFAELRNKAAHFCLQVPRSVAEQAGELAQRNLAEFEKNWRQSAEAVPPCVTEALSWDKLCDLCGVTFLPPRTEGVLS